MEYPMDVNAMKLLADIGIKFRAYKDAGYLLTRALDLSPEYDPARLSYANLLYKRQLPFEALKHINILLEITRFFYFHPLHLNKAFPFR